MKVCLDIEFQDSIVCILGGGKVAYRKTKQFLEAGAKIYIFSLNYDPNFSECKVYKVDHETLIHILPKAKLAIACTDDPKANEAFIQKARSYNVLTMSCHRNQNQDTFSTVYTRDKNLMLACDTNGSFPAANKNILNDWKKRLNILKKLRDNLKDRSKCNELLSLNDHHCLFFKEAIHSHKAIIYLLHGNDSLNANCQCTNLINKTNTKFPHCTITTFFLSKKYQDISLETFCELLTSLGIKPHFVLLFWQNGSYVNNAKNTLNKFQYSYQHIQIDPTQFKKDHEVLAMHTKQIKPQNNVVLVSMLDSPFLKAQYPQARFVACLEDQKVIERIVNETNPNF